MTNVFIIFFLGLTVLIVISCLIAWVTVEIQDRIAKKKREKLIQDYPELKLLLSEYMRQTNEHAQTCQDIYDLKKQIDDLIQKNSYLPKDKKIDDHIEELKKILWELEEIKEVQSLDRTAAHKKLELFWETNFPNLKEGKRIMWWYW